MKFADFAEMASEMHAASLIKCDHELTAARYAFHKVTAHRYALAHVRGEMSLDEAQHHYTEAMRNYDGIVAGAANTVDAVERELAKGADAVVEVVEEIQMRQAT